MVKEVADPRELVAGAADRRLNEQVVGTDAPSFRSYRRHFMQVWMNVAPQIEPLPVWVLTSG